MTDLAPLHAAAKALLAAMFLFASSLPAQATTKGLNQIVTPDIQPAGVVSLSVQAQNPAIGNPLQVQYEIGVSPRFEAAVFQGLSPGKFVCHAELGLLQKPPFLLSTGLLNYSPPEDSPQPFLEAGYYKGKQMWIAGVQRGDGLTLGVFGWAYRITPRLLLAADYQSGPGNFSTAGFTYSITQELSFNPAVYISNDSPHQAFGYAVLSWSFKIGQ